MRILLVRQIIQRCNKTPFQHRWITRTFSSSSGLPSSSLSSTSDVIFRDGSTNVESFGSESPKSPISSLIDDWDPAEESGEILADFPDFSQQFVAGTHPAEILTECRGKRLASKWTAITDVVDSWFPVDGVFHFLSALQTQFGLSWAGSIVAASLIIRSLLVPITLANEKARRKSSVHQPATRDFYTDIKLIRQRKLPDMTIDDAKNKYFAYRKNHKIPWVPKALILQSLIQVPLLITFWRCIYVIASCPEQYKEFTMEAPLWFDSLALPDPLWILPLLYCGIAATNIDAMTATDRNIQVRMLLGRSSKIPSSHQPWLDRSLLTSKSSRVGILLSVFLVAKFPVGLLLYTTTNQVCQALVAGICRFRSVEKYLDLPPNQLGIMNDLMKLLSKAPKRFPSLNVISNVSTLIAAASKQGLTRSAVVTREFLQKYNLGLRGIAEEPFQKNDGSAETKWKSYRPTKRETGASKKHKGVEFVDAYLPQREK